MRLSVHRKLFLSHFLAVLLVSGSIGSYFYWSAVRSLTESVQLRLESTAALIAQTLDAQELAGIRGAADTSLPAYERGLELIRNLARTNPDIAYAYVMRHSGGRVFFVLDSDESSEQATPGREYEEHTPSLLRGFQRPSVDDQVYEDEWGAFMSGYAPVRNGNGEYLAGIDMRAAELGRKLSTVRVAGALSFGLSVLLAALFSRVLAAQLTKPIRILIERCRAIAQGDSHQSVRIESGDELEELVGAFNAMSRRVSESSAEALAAQQSLRQAKDLLELRVQERTKDLMEVNERLLHEVAERARAEEQLAQVARSDPLTGLMNRRAMLEQLEYQAARHQRTGSPFTLLLADLDHFKRVNDSFGHDAGDQALIHTAQQLSRGTRAQDLTARWGGEEFLILLPDTGLEGGVHVAEVLRENLASSPADLSGRPLKLSLSIGVATYVRGQTLSQCIKSADMALYEAKRLGRNRVIAGPQGAAAPG